MPNCMFVILSYIHFIVTFHESRLRTSTTISVMFPVKYFLQIIFLCFSPHLICCGEYIIFGIISDIPNRTLYLMMPL